METPDEHDTWRRADEIFGKLIDLPPAEQRKRLAALDLPPPVRSRVRRLLQALQGEAGILDYPAPLASILETGALYGRRLGRWELRDEIGRGGMSVVYRAYAIEGPAGQDAAVKVLTLGALAGSGRSRFLREQASLLRLRHPYIAPMLDAGIARDGTPWLAMTLVDGKRIDAWCDERGLDAAARVGLVLQVCEAVAHAHRNLVIHRDIKPSNVLVDDDGRVRLLDFGIARMVDAGEGEHTETALRVLTPEYAAPEQFAGAPATTAMDVYGIGALLYRLLAGTPPPTGAAPEPTSRGVRGRERRSTAAQARRPALPGDLDAVVSKALAPEPEARYAGVGALADDLERWLEGRPVLARPPSLRYRFGRFLARNRLATGAAAALLLALLGGLAATLWQARVAHAAAARAELAAERHRQAQQDTAEALVRSNAIRDFLFELFRNNIPGGPLDQVPSTLELLERAANSVDERFVGDPETQAEFLATIAIVYEERQVPGATRLLRKALALRAQRRQEAPVPYAVAQSQLAASLPMEHAAEKEALHDAAVAALRRHAPGSLQLARAYEARSGVGNIRRSNEDRIQDMERAWTILSGREEADPRERLRISSNLAVSYHRSGAYRKSAARYDDALETARELHGDVHQQVAILLGNRGGVYSSLGMFDKARADLQTALDHYRKVLERPDEYVLAALVELEMAAYRQGDFAAALDWRSRWDRVLTRTTDLESLARRRARSDVWRARSLARLGRNREALEMARRGLAVLDADARVRPREEVNLLQAHSLLLRLACATPERPQLSGIDRALAQVLALAPAREQGVRASAAAEGYALAALCTLRRQGAAQALALFDQAAGVDARLPPGHAAAVAERMLWHGQALQQVGRRAEAQAMWRRGARLLRERGLARHPVHAQLVSLGTERDQ